MKNLKIYLLPLLMILSLAGCEKASEGISFETNYVVITPEGGTVVLITGEEYVEPGFTATENGEDVSASVEVTNNIKKTEAGFYTVTYSAINSDGYSASAKRTVQVQSVADFSSSLDGIYLATILRDDSPAYENLEFIIVDNKLECAIGGYYSNGRNYGPAYAATGATVTINNSSTNDFSITDAVVSGFGAEVKISEMVVDTSKEEISWDGASNELGSVFSVTLERIKKQ